jgi:hypothetical protein
MLPGMRILDPGSSNPRSESSDRLTYQVTFWQRDAEPGQVPPDDAPFISDVWQLADTDGRRGRSWSGPRAGGSAAQRDQVVGVHELAAELGG